MIVSLLFVFVFHSLERWCPAVRCFGEHFERLSHL